jgi:dCTP deaminase
LLDDEIGVLNELQMRMLLEEGIVENLDEHSIDGSAFDLHLSSEAWRLSATAKLSARETVRELLNSQTLKPEKFSLNQQVLKQKQVYIVRLKENVRLDKYEGSFGLYGRASGKSSIGRLDVLTRLLVDHTPKYDEVPPFHGGELFLEVIPISFDIKVEEGKALHQLRMFKGHPDLCRLSMDQLTKMSPMLYSNEHEPVEPRDGILRVNLQPDEGGRVAFVSKKNPPELDLTKDTDKDKIDPRNYWNVIKKNKFGLRMGLNRFYILRSKERLFLPDDVAVSCVAYSENLGELRIHYAGFAHPNFGRRRTDNRIGAPLIFEARSHSFGVVVRDKEQFAKIEFFKMSKASQKTSNYSGQELKLSNCFAEWAS